MSTEPAAAQLLDRPWSRTAVIAIAGVGGGFVEYWWPAIAMCLAAWRHCRRPSMARLVTCFHATFALNLNGWAFGAMPLVNASTWAIAAFPIILGVMRLDLSVPRLRWLPYAYYPAHLTALWLLSA